MGNRGQTHTQGDKHGNLEARLPAPTASYRRRAWLEFQRAIDPLAPIKPQPRRQHRAA
jgi:hypothetical protein